jgi:phasin
MAKENDTGDPAAPFRAAAERSVEQARKAFDDMMGFAQKTVSGFETNSSQIQGTVRDLTRETLDFAGEAAEATFALVDRLSKAKSPEEAVQIQKAYVEEQMQRLGRQARSIGDTTIKAAQDLTKPFER